MANLRVALITPWERKGGIATYSDRLVGALDDEGVEVTPIPVTEPETGNPLGFIELLSKVPPDVDVVHVQYEAGLFGRFGMSGVGAPAFFLALCRAERPVVTTIHEVHRRHPHRGRIGDVLLRARDFCIEQLVLRASDFTVVHSREAEEVLRDRHGDLGQIGCLLHPVEADAEPIPMDEAKAEFDISGEILLTFGWVEEKKRYADVIQALPGLPSVTYLIAGPKRDEEGETVLDATFELAEDLGVRDRVRYLGYVDEGRVPYVFSAADVVVLPYERVSQSGVVNDALSYHRPVVATDLPAFEEIQDEYGCILTYGGGANLQSELEDALYDSVTRERLMSNAEEYTNSVTWSWFAGETRELYLCITDDSP